MKLPLAGMIIASLAAVGGASSATAQGVGIYIGPPPAYVDDDYDYPYTTPGASNFAPRVYGYTRRYTDRDRPRLRRAGRCGEYRYWDGDACVDARSR